MKVLFRIGAVLAGVLLIAAPGAAQSGDRLTDTDVKRLIDNVDQARDHFESQLDAKVKNSIVRGAMGEIQVKSSLEDFHRDLDNLKTRFTTSYGASVEVQTVLRRANVLQAIVEAQPEGLKGASEWDKLAVELRGLALAYNATFPLAEGAIARRISDAEATGAVLKIADQAEVIKRVANADKTLAKAAKETLKAQAEDVIKQAKLLQTRLENHKPAATEMRGLLDKLAPLTAEGAQLPPDALKAIGLMRAPMDKLKQAFGIGVPTT